MVHSDMAAYPGVPLSAPSKGLRTLTPWGIMQSRNGGYMKVIDRDAFDMLAGNVNLRIIASE
jgi:hypothetical protein